MINTRLDIQHLSYNYTLNISTKTTLYHQNVKKKIKVQVDEGWNQQTNKQKSVTSIIQIGEKDERN